MHLFLHKRCFYLRYPMQCVNSFVLTVYTTLFMTKIKYRHVHTARNCVIALLSARHRTSCYTELPTVRHHHHNNTCDSVLYVTNSQYCHVRHRISVPLPCLFLQVIPSLNHNNSFTLLTYKWCKVWHTFTNSSHLWPGRNVSLPDSHSKRQTSCDSGPQVHCCVIIGNTFIATHFREPTATRTAKGKLRMTSIPLSLLLAQQLPIADGNTWQTREEEVNWWEGRGGMWKDDKWSGAW